MSKEGALVRLFYGMESTLRRLILNMKQRFRRRHVDAAGRAGDEPNFYMGRKISPRIREELKREGIL